MRDNKGVVNNSMIVIKVRKFGFERKAKVFLGQYNVLLDRKDDLEVEGDLSDEDNSLMRIGYHF